MKIMVFDTETSGLPLWGEPSEDKRQPHIVQYTAVLTDADTQQELDFENLLVKPDGWAIDPDAMKAHGIAMETLLAEGMPEHYVVDCFTAMAKQADLVVGYNVAFDLRMMRIAMLRFGYTKQGVDDFARTHVKKHCCQVQATPLARIPPTDKMMAAGRKTWKTPNLGEAVKAILGEEMDDAHDARADVLWTQRLYFAMNPTGKPAK